MLGHVVNSNKCMVNMIIHTWYSMSDGSLHLLQANSKQTYHDSHLHQLLACRSLSIHHSISTLKIELLPIASVGLAVCFRMDNIHC